MAPPQRLTSSKSDPAIWLAIVSDLARVDAQAKTEGARMASFAAAASRSSDGSGLRTARASATACSIAHPVVPCREHGVGRAVQNRYDPREPVAGQALQRAHDWHGAADRGFEAQLPALARGERPKRRPVARHELFVCGDDRFACKERRAQPLGGRLQTADRLDHDVDIARQDIVDAIGPDDSASAAG
jgi:hypothetical protein